MEGNYAMDTPGAGPSGLRDGAKEPLRFNLSSKETIEKKKEDMLLQRRQDLTKILDLHDDLVREAFHLEKFVTLVSYDPKVAKDDKSAVFEEYRRKYDLLAHTKQGGSKGRKTRGTTQGFRDQLGNLITSPSPAPSTSKSYFIKGKGKGGPSPANPTEFGSPPSRRLTLHATPTSLRTPSKRKPPPNPHPPSLSPTPTRIRIIRPPATPKFPVAATFTPHRTLRHARLLESPQNDSSRTWEPTVFTPKHRASASPTESPRMLKRIKLVHRPKLEYSDPTQIPPRPQHSYSLSSLLDSYYFLDDETVVSSGELDAIAEREARKRNKIARLRETGVFENHERKLDTTPPDEPKRQLDHRDHLVAHAVSVGKAIRENLKARQAGAKRIAKMVEKHFEKVAGADTKEQKAEEKRRQLLVKFVLKEVVKEWKLAVAVIRSRKKEELKAEQMRRGKEHLDAFLQQSTQVLEAQHSELVSSSFAKRPSASRSSKSRASSFARSLSVASSLRLSLLEPCDTTTPLEPSSVVHVNNGGLTESEEEAESVIVGVTDSDDDGELHLRVSSPPPEEELPSVENGSLSAGHANTSHEPVNEIEVVNAPAEPPETPPRRSSSHGLNGLNGPENGFDVFQYRDDEQIDILDRQFDAEMEEEEGADERSDDSELDGLQKDVDVPIEEILRQYGYIIPNQASPAATADNLSVASSSRPQTPDAPRDLPPEPIDNPVALLDDGFQAGDLPALDDDDHRLEMEMEAEEGDESDDAELNGLEQDAEVSIEELLRRYGYAMNNQEDVDDHPTANGVVKDALERKELVTVVQPSPGSPLDVEMKDEIAVEVATSRSRTPTPSPAASLLDEEESVEDPDDEDASDAETSGSVRELSVGENGLSMKVPPPFLLRGTLRPYQQAGLEWLASLHSNDTNGILADEMGLGKTIQTIALLGYLACSKGIWGPHLIIVPTSVLLNWEMEFKKFLPGFRTLSYYGTQKERKEKRQGWTSQHAFNVCITSYQLALADHQIFRRKKWVYMILDEAHNIKNFKSKRWETLLCFNAQHRLLLTGTPLQNNLMELWSLLYFLMPDEGFARDTDDAQLFVRRQDFKDLFQNPVERAIESGQGMTDETRDTVQKLHTLLRPYLLRRLKSEVEQQLPAKHEHIVYCRLSKRQRFLYDEFMSRAATKETLASGNFLSIVNCLMQLRKVCNHPNLFEVRPISTSFAMPRSAVADYEIKELLVRRRLLNSDPLNDLDLGFLGLHIARYQPNSEIVERSTRRLDASSQFPCISQLPGEAPPLDTHTIAGWKLYQAWQVRTSTINRWKQMAYVNRLRCTRRSIYSSELLRAFGSLRQPVLPLAAAEKERRNCLDRIDCVNSMVQTYEERLDSISSVVDRFAFATPRAVARDVAPLFLSEVRDHVRSLAFDETYDTLHRPAVKLQIAFPDASLIQFDCGKLQELDSLLREKAAGGHRVLIFTQMTRVLDILEVFLNLHGYRYLRLDGATKIEQRQIITERFNIDSRIFAFIASSRSGGVGINLTGADTVIFYDSDYNPSMDRQCEDRAHRIGQMREVHIYRFISSHTVEEAMLRKANQKRSLDDMVIQKGEFDWRKMLADELDGGSGGRKLEEALAVVEDKEDAEAARVAAAEFNLDATEFNENTPADRAEGLGVDLDAQPGDADEEGAEEGPEDDGIGSISDYMLRMVERDWAYFGFERPYGAR